MIKVNNISYSIKNNDIIHNISLNIKPGQMISIIGPNGAGKSTLMNMISGYLSPTSGEIFVCGKNIKENPLWGREHIGFLPEGSPLYSDLTVKKFLYYMAELRGCKHSAADEAMHV